MHLWLIRQLILRIKIVQVTALIALIKINICMFFDKFRRMVGGHESCRQGKTSALTNNFVFHFCSTATRYVIMAVNSIIYAIYAEDNVNAEQKS
jgi:hypothetical protein